MDKDGLRPQVVGELLKWKAAYLISDLQIVPVQSSRVLESLLAVKRQ